MFAAAAELLDNAQQGLDVEDGGDVKQVVSSFIGLPPSLLPHLSPSQLSSLKVQRHTHVFTGAQGAG